MAYASTTLQLLISAPGDISANDRNLIKDAVNSWNFNNGPYFQLTIVPVWWEEHASAEFGSHPQDAINRQLVDSADLALAIFWTRYGTGNNRSASGTAEEIKRMAEAGKTVSVLHCKRQIPSDFDLDQFQQLKDYLKSIESEALVMPYDNDLMLQRRVESLLSGQANIFMGKIKSAEEQEHLDLGVWPSTDIHEEVRTDSRGRVKTKKSRYLVLTNQGKTPAHNVRFELDGDGSIILADEKAVLKTLGPESHARFNLALTMGSPRQFDCTVRWETPGGEERESTATLRPI